MSEERPDEARPDEARPGTGAGAEPPAEISHLVRERVEARRARNWARADDLKRRIEESGWKVVDHGGRTSVSRAAPVDVSATGMTRYGTWRTVPSRLAEPPLPGATVVTVASEQPDRIRRLLDALASHSPGIDVVVVANDPSAAQERGLAEAEAAFRDGSLALEIVGTAARLGYAAALNVGLQRVGREVAIVADGTAWPVGDTVTPIVAALADSRVAVAGAFGLSQFEPGPLRPAAVERAAHRGAGETLRVAALELAWLGFRRADYAALGPVEEAFMTAAWLDVWWSFRLRTGNENAEAGEGEARERGEGEAGEGGETGQGLEGGETGQGLEGGETGQGLEGGETGQGLEVGEPLEAEPETPLRAAVQLDLPLERDETPWPPERIRINRRNAYRVLDAFGARPDLLAEVEAEGKSG